MEISELKIKLGDIIQIKSTKVDSDLKYFFIEYVDDELIKIVNIENGNIHFWGYGNDLITNYSINDDKYHKISVSYDGSAIAIFIDGNYIANSTIPIGNGSRQASFSLLNTATNTLFAIGNTNFGGNSLNADIKNCLIFNSALTQAQIAALPTALAGTEPNLVGRSQV